MSIVHVVGKGGSLASDRTLFIGARIPEEIKILPTHLKSIDKQTFRKFLQVLVTSFEGKEVKAESIQELADILTEDTFAKIFSGLHRLLHAALRLPSSSLKQQDFQDDLVELRIPKDFIQDITSLVFGSRRRFIDKHRAESGPHLPTLSNFKWRVDVAISTSVLNRVLEPTILAEMTLSNGQVHNFEIPMKKFHELRYNMAAILKDMEHLEQRNILKIQD